MSCAMHTARDRPRLPVPAALVVWLLVASTIAVSALAQLRSDCSLPGASCTLAQTAAQAGVWIGEAIADPSAAPEQATVPGHFNALTSENAMKWGSLAPTVAHYDFATADAVVAFAQRTHSRLRAHTLVWHSQQPRDLETEVEAAPDPAARLRELMRQHIRTVVERYRGKVAVWDVVNEPLDDVAGKLRDSVFSRLLGEAYIGEAFRLTRELDPDAELFLNEFLLGYSGSKANGLRSLLRRLLDQGVPIDGVGIQAHFFPVFTLATRDQIQGYLRSIADLGLKVEITELDVSISHFLDDPDPLARQAEFYRDVVAACMAVTACQAVTLWGIHDGNSWLDRAPPWDAQAPNRPLLFDADLMPKPAYYAVRDALASRAPRFFDCSGDRTVTVDELVVAVGIALEARPLADCPAFDVSGDGTVTIDELTAAVGQALVS